MVFSSFPPWISRFLRFSDRLQEFLEQLSIRPPTLQWEFSIGRASVFAIGNQSLSRFRCGIRSGGEMCALTGLSSFLIGCQPWCRRRVARAQQKRERKRETRGRNGGLSILDPRTISFLISFVGYFHDFFFFFFVLLCRCPFRYYRFSFVRTKGRHKEEESKEAWTMERKEGRKDGRK